MTSSINLTAKQREILTRAANGGNAYRKSDGKFAEGAQTNSYRHVVERLESMGLLTGWNITDAGLEYI